MRGVRCDVRRREGCGVAVWDVDIGAVYPHLIPTDKLIECT